MILVVDDEITIADTLRAILMHAGYAPFAHYDGPSAIEMARVVPPDLLLTDFVLPGMTGLELAIEVTKICPACEVIIFSGLVSAVDMSRMSRDRDFVLLEKPLHPDILVSRIAGMLQPATPVIPIRPGK